MLDHREASRWLEEESEFPHSHPLRYVWQHVMDDASDMTAHLPPSRVARGLPKNTRCPPPTVTAPRFSSTVLRPPRFLHGYGPFSILLCTQQPVSVILVKVNWKGTLPRGHLSPEQRRAWAPGSRAGLILGYEHPRTCNVLHATCPRAATVQQDPANSRSSLATVAVGNQTLSLAELSLTPT